MEEKEALEQKAKDTLNSLSGKETRALLRYLVNQTREEELVEVINEEKLTPEVRKISSLLLTSLDF